MNVYNCDVPVIIMTQIEAFDEKGAKRIAEDIVYRFLNMAVEDTKFVEESNFSEVMDWDWDWKRNTKVDLFMEK